MLDHPLPVGSTGMTEAILALSYDPSVLTISAADITLGSIPGRGAGWQLHAVVDPTTGQIGIELYSTVSITTAQAGSQVNMAFHVMPGAAGPTTAVQLVNSVLPDGHQFTTQVDDVQGQFVLSPGMDRLAVATGGSPAAVALPVTMENGGAAAVTKVKAVDRQLPGLPEETAGTTLLGSDDVLAVMSNGTVAGETVPLHTVPTSLVVTGALAFQTNAATLAATQLTAQVFQIGNTSVASNLLNGNSLQQLADRLFQALARSTDLSTDVAQDKLWDGANLNQAWLAIPSQDTAREIPAQSADAVAESQTSGRQDISDRVAALDKVFAELAVTMDDFSDFGDY
jgi:hypothetical protein